MPRTCCRLGRRNRGSGNTAALRKAAQTPTAASRSSGCSNQHRTHYSSRAHPREYTKTKPRGRSRCTSTREAPRNKSRGRADRTLVLGRRGAAAQNAGSRPGLPLNAPDTAAGTLTACTRLTALSSTLVTAWASLRQRTSPASARSPPRCTSCAARPPSPPRRYRPLTATIPSRTGGRSAPPSTPPRTTCRVRRSSAAACPAAAAASSPTRRSCGRCCRSRRSAAARRREEACWTRTSRTTATTRSRRSPRSSGAWAAARAAR